MRVVVIEHLSLDGVLQGPGRPEEDIRDDFRHGGWAGSALQDPEVGAALGSRMSADFSWLLGRRSYDDMLGYWNETGGPFKDGLNNVHKYVATGSPGDLPWPNSTPLTGDVPAEVAALRERPGGDLVVMGSGELVRSLLARQLVDELFLMIHPVVLGSGRRLFGAGGAPHSLRLVAGSATSSGVLLATYQRVAEEAGSAPSPA